MARAAKTTKSKSKTPAKGSGKTARRPRPLRFLVKRAVQAAVALALLLGLAVLSYRFVNPPGSFYMWSEGRRLGSPVSYAWVDAEDVAPVALRALVAAEDANFCTHWGFDMRAIRAAIAEGGNRGASTISQQVVKNAFLWQGRSWPRKALEAALTPLMEALWPKRRILEVYMNIAEFDEGVFGIKAASQHYFGVAPSQLTSTQAARLAAILPDPKDRSASNPSSFVQRRTGQIRDGAATIARDGRARCFE
ncbi:monofunctional biosynthetic peptidoglycan transglycosylase [Yangia mangrovi]|uniref:Biosynthetic peptidoglycan transglycosylase n=1 Tax=Alloyangia mangrovi TaxID=1779329 RepID=A0A2A3JX21_9RHOB|nr:monofunctional biosynthetic peptidoglycan transglycosylase [Alloyangia mangrovi]MCA0940027.1 monofunctional biosynthetic peptidoglycan transglycosylase [Alloyangia pacifica]MCA0945806.1 monofunctional biosynthetic peptidoglycan transglycosylase [Alloyangia pacifica]MCT4371875.1 monofunctional biosynthetic peptidoglycan transglycosylase [Alloyangia mangrovi]